MSITHLRVAGAVLFFVFIFLSGIWLSSSGKPYNSAILNVHKLISLAAVVFLGITVYQINKTSRLSAAELIAAVVTGALILGTIISGGLSSIGTMPTAILTMHQITPESFLSHFPYSYYSFLSTFT